MTAESQIHLNANVPGRIHEDDELGCAASVSSGVVMDILTGSFVPLWTMESPKQVQPQRK
jgi:hypothetical protein